MIKPRGLKRINLSIWKINMLGKAHFTSAALDEFVASSDKNQANDGDISQTFFCVDNYHVE
ncbi:MAG: hypothetical protein WBZ20_17890 [Nitrososphaeraceae archaeon]